MGGGDVNDKCIGCVRARIFEVDFGVYLAKLASPSVV